MSNPSPQGGAPAGPRPCARAEGAPSLGQYPQCNATPGPAHLPSPHTRRRPTTVCATCPSMPTDPRSTTRMQAKAGWRGLTPGGCPRPPGTAPATAHPAWEEGQPGGAVRTRMWHGGMDCMSWALSVMCGEAHLAQRGVGPAEPLHVRQRRVQQPCPQRVHVHVPAAGCRVEQHRPSVLAAVHPYRARSCIAAPRWAGPWPR